jgi:hypothetical protein
MSSQAVATPMTGASASVQREAEEEEALQGTFVQRLGEEEEEPLQGAFVQRAATTEEDEAEEA